MGDEVCGAPKDLLGASHLAICESYELIGDSIFSIDSVDFDSALSGLLISSTIEFAN